MKETLTAGAALTSVHASLYLLSAAAWLAVVFVLRLRRIRGTTLVAPWIWGTISVVTLAGVEASLAIAGSPTTLVAQALRYAAAMGTFCPIVALLGAKRPQNTGWQWIVLSLWAILCQPSIEWLLFGGVAEIHPARFWFLVILILVGATNGLGTRNWPASSAFCVGQIILLLPYFSAQPWIASHSAAWWGLQLLFLWGLWLTLTGYLARRVAGNQLTGIRLNRVWLDFRDEFGVVWSLRIIERMNAAASMYDWPVILTWHGFEPRVSSTYQDAPAVVEESFRTLLRRFVSPAWIDARMGESINPERQTVSAT